MFTLPRLPYAFDALEPTLDARTMELHYTKHHQTYVDKLNAALEPYKDLLGWPVERLLQEIDTLPITETARTAVRNHGGGHANHSFFWTILGPEKEVDEQLVADITASFGGVEEFKKQFSDVALAHFGSGWAWLTRSEGKLHVHSTSNQDSPLMTGHTPVLGLDVWEHAYYLKYQNRRAEYIAAWWSALKLLP